MVSDLLSWVSACVPCASITGHRNQVHTSSLVHQGLHHLNKKTGTQRYPTLVSDLFAEGIEVLNINLGINKKNICAPSDPIRMESLTHRPWYSQCECLYRPLRAQSLGKMHFDEWLESTSSRHIIIKQKVDLEDSLKIGNGFVTQKAQSSNRILLPFWKFNRLTMFNLSISPRTAKVLYMFPDSFPSWPSTIQASLM